MTHGETGEVRRGPRTWVVVALTLAAVAFTGLVFVAGLVTGVVATKSTDTASPGTAPLPQPTDTSGGGEGPSGDALDPCLVGTWRTLEHTESGEVQGKKVTITGVDRTVTIGADGSERVTYGSRPATIAVDGGNATLTFSGTATYAVTSAGGTLSFKVLGNDAKVTVQTPGKEPKTEAVKPGTGDVRYTCDDTRFTQSAQGYAATFERVS